MCLSYDYLITISLKYIIDNAITYDLLHTIKLTHSVHMHGVHMGCTLIHYYYLAVLCTSSAKQVPCTDPENSIRGPDNGFAGV